jgi:hypothetical protein
MVKLTPEQQRTFIEKAPEVFTPCHGAWGKKGCTNVRLSAAKLSELRPALQAAAENVAAQKNRGSRQRPSLPKVTPRSIEQL